MVRLVERYNCETGFMLRSFFELPYNEVQKEVIWSLYYGNLNKIYSK